LNQLLTTRSADNDGSGHSAPFGKRELIYMADNETISIRLDNELTVNGIKYLPGNKVVVPKEQADDLSRMDSDFNKYKDNLHRKNVYEKDAGSMSVGSGS
jgi:hypothetical protein